MLILAFNLFLALLVMALTITTAQDLWRAFINRNSDTYEDPE